MQITSIPQYKTHSYNKDNSAKSKRQPTFTSAIKTCTMPALLISGIGLITYGIKTNPAQIKENEEVAELNTRIDVYNAKIRSTKETETLKQLERALENLSKKKCLDAETCSWLIDLCHSELIKNPQFAKAVAKQLINAQKAMLKNMSKEERDAFLKNQEKAYAFLKKKTADKYLEANQNFVSAPYTSPQTLITDVKTLSSPEVSPFKSLTALDLLENSEDNLKREMSEQDYRDFETIYRAVFEENQEIAIKNAQKQHYEPQKMPLPTSLPVYSGFLFLFLSGMLAVGDLLGIGKED